MKDSLRLKLDNLIDRQEELGHLLSDPAIISDQNKFRKLNIELSDITPIVENYQRFTQLEEDYNGAKEMLEESGNDPEMKEMAQEEMRGASSQIEELEANLQILLLPKDPTDDRNIFLEIRAGTGGDEAAIFSGDLFKMYSTYAATQ
jgi:peptide chain release factor 1